WPIPSSASMNAAIAGDTPSASAVSAMTGVMAPLPASKAKDGRNADGATAHRLNGRDAVVAVAPVREVTGVSRSVAGEQAPQGRRVRPRLQVASQPHDLVRHALPEPRVHQRVELFHDIRPRHAPAIPVPGR